MGQQTTEVGEFEATLGIREIAEELGVSKMCAWRMVRRGELPAVKVPTRSRWGFEWRVRGKDFLAFRENYLAEPPPRKIQNVLAPDGWMSVRDAAKLIGGQAHDVFRLIEDGTIRATELSFRTWVLEEDVRAMLNPPCVADGEGADG